LKKYTQFETEKVGCLEDSYKKQ